MLFDPSITRPFLNYSFFGFFPSMIVSFLSGRSFFITSPFVVVTISSLGLDTSLQWRGHSFWSFFFDSFLRQRC